MTPTIGRIVHYHSHGTPTGEDTEQPRAAIITEVHENTVVVGRNADTLIEAEVTLVVFHPNVGTFFNRAPFSETPRPGHWSWPPRVGA